MNSNSIRIGQREEDRQKTTLTAKKTDKRQPFLNG